MTSKAFCTSLLLKFFLQRALQKISVVLYKRQLMLSKLRILIGLEKVSV